MMNQFDLLVRSLDSEIGNEIDLFCTRARNRIIDVVQNWSKLREQCIIPQWLYRDCQNALPLFELHFAMDRSGFCRSIHFLFTIGTQTIHSQPVGDLSLLFQRDL